MQGIGIRVKVWLNISGEYGDDTDDFSPDSQVHYIGDVNYYLGKPTGLFDSFASTHYTPAYQLQLVATGGAIASKSQLSFSDPVATVSAKDKGDHRYFTTAHQRHHQHPANPDGVYCR